MLSLSDLARYTDLFAEWPAEWFSAIKTNLGRQDAFDTGIEGRAGEAGNNNEILIPLKARCQGMKDLSFIEDIDVLVKNKRVFYKVIA